MADYGATPKKLYRYREEMVWDGYTSIKVSVVCEQYSVVARTPKGVWIAMWGNSDKHKWVSLHSRKRWAYPDKESALESFKIRKHRQIEHLSRQLTLSERALDIVNNDPKFTRSIWGERASKLYKSQQFEDF